MRRAQRVLHARLGEMDPVRLARLTNRGTRFRRSAALMSQTHARLYRSTGGRLMRRWFGSPVLVLETVGRRSGKLRETPLIEVRHGDGWVVLAANAAAAQDPAWWLNLREAGAATVVVRGTRHDVRPRVLDGAERAAAWDAFVAVYPPAGEYPKLTPRELPLIALEPADPTR
jgi:deazaflavin-dependent oxidoreductase (nitroreductase family)